MSDEPKDNSKKFTPPSTGAEARNGFVLPVTLPGNVSVGVTNAGFDVFTSRTLGALTVDLGLLSISGPPQNFRPFDFGRDLNAKAQSYGEQFIGADAAHYFKSGASVVGYAGSTFDGDPALGARYTLPLPNESRLALDAHKQESLTSVGLYYSWNSKEGAAVTQSLETGLSLRNGDPVASATYRADKELDHGVNVEFSASTALEHGEVDMSATVTAFKKLREFQIASQSLALEVGPTVTLDKGKGASFGVGWKLSGLEQ